MFRCEHCGSGYSMRAATSWACCPRCLAREKTTVPLTFELGWRGRDGSPPRRENQEPVPMRSMTEERTILAVPSRGPS